jgi:hypothetical protein
MLDKIGGEPGVSSTGSRLFVGTGRYPDATQGIGAPFLNKVLIFARGVKQEVTAVVLSGRFMRVGRSTGAAMNSTHFPPPQMLVTCFQFCYLSPPPNKPSKSKLKMCANPRRFIRMAISTASHIRRLAAGISNFVARTWLAVKDLDMAVMDPHVP